MEQGNDSLKYIGHESIAEGLSEFDVCLIVEGCYPFVAGGVSSWLDWLMRTQPDLNFAVIAIVAGTETALQPRYEFPENLRYFSIVKLHSNMPDHLYGFKLRPERRDELAAALVSLLRNGRWDDFVTVNQIINCPRNGLSLAQLMNSRLNWDLICQTYNALMPQASFLHFYWAWRALFGGMFAALKAPLPPAKVYHTISTGYAGLIAARATIERGRPAAITEHGIYTNERRIEILMADWISDTVDKGIRLDDERIDLRDVWGMAFNAYARVCYEACEVITTLYVENQRLQQNLGASAQKLRVIANGIKVERFEKLPVAGPELPPTMGLIGRVVPIKDVKTYIGAAARVRDHIHNLQALIMGPTDEDPLYYQECLELVQELGLEGCVIFTGKVNIIDYLPRLHTMVLTSLSEAQPLVLLEAGAAGIPCVATDVGSCREILFGRDDDDRSLGVGGAITGLVATDQIADAVSRLLVDEPLRRQQGETLRQRVRRYYASDIASEKYAELYKSLCARPTRSIPEKRK